MVLFNSSKLEKSDFETKKKQTEVKKKAKRVQGKVKISPQLVKEQWGSDLLPPAIGIICGPNPIQLDSSVTFQGLSKDINEKGVEKTRIILSAQLEQTDFLGDSELGCTTEQQVKYSLGVYDKSEGSLKLMPILAGRPIPIRPRLKRKTYGDEDVSSVLRHDQDGIIVDRKDKDVITYDQRQEIWLKANNTFSKKINPDKKKPMAIKVEKKTARGRR
eukprot:TRINITY_DN28039_c1_g2_i1.p2 TRINITY_DN28039_c1_g2~~TRINITY_DN28039_c1_g2_i1.p2  ORF type:complete len:217 (-),score=11.94 TRINITY_DN28039_c1_g2_i1:184-834(-)